MTLGRAAAATVIRFRVWCKDCHREVMVDPAEMAERYGASLSVPDWRKRLVCQCGSRNVDAHGIEKRLLIAWLRGELRRLTGRDYRIDFAVLDVDSLKELQRVVRDLDDEIDRGRRRIDPWPQRLP